MEEGYRDLAYSLIKDITKSGELAVYDVKSLFAPTMEVRINSYISSVGCTSHYFAVMVWGRYKIDMLSDSSYLSDENILFLFKNYKKIVKGYERYKECRIKAKAKEIAIEVATKKAVIKKSKAITVPRGTKPLS